MINKTKYFSTCVSTDDVRNLEEIVSKKKSHYFKQTGNGRCPINNKYLIKIQDHIIYGYPKI